MQFRVFVVINASQKWPYSILLLFVLEVDDVRSKISKNIWTYL